MSEPEDTEVSRLRTAPEHVGPSKSTNGTTSVETRQLPPAPEVKALPPAPPKPRRLPWRGVLWLLILGGIGYAGFRYYQGAEQKRAAAERAQEERVANRSVSVAASRTRRGDIPIFLRGLGTVTAYNTVNVKTRVDGPIVKVNFQEGQYVKEGEVLVEIDPRTYQATLDQALGALARDQAQLKDAQVNEARYQKLWQEQVIAKQQYDTQTATVGQFLGNIESDKANIESARLNLNFCEIKAPIGGRIGLRMVDIGNIVHASDQNALAVITQMQPIAVIFTIPADSLPPVLAKLRAGVRLTVQAYDRADVNRIATGYLETVDNQIDPTTGTSRLKAIFDNRDEALYPQQFVNCRLLLDTKHGVVITPVPAVQHGPDGAYVYVVKQDGTASMRRVTTGTTEGNDVEITSGLTPGEMVITDGQDKLQDGTRVEIRPDSGARPASTPSSPAGSPSGETIRPANTPPPPPQGAQNPNGGFGRSTGQGRGRHRR